MNRRETTKLLTAHASIHTLECLLIISCIVCGGNQPQTLALVVGQWLQVEWGVFWERCDQVAGRVHCLLEVSGSSGWVAVRGPGV